MNFYEADDSAAQFISFLNSENGKIQKQILLQAIRSRLPDNRGLAILDAACGNGWLSKELKSFYHLIKGFDSSPGLIEDAKRSCPDTEFLLADASGKLPYGDGTFDAIILNMASHDLEDQPKTFANFFKLLKPGGKLLLTLANPYYSFPVGVWKRGILGRLLGKKPSLKLRPYNFFRRGSNRAFAWQNKLTSRFYPLSEQINNLLQSGFRLTAYEDLQTTADSPAFNAAYQLHRFPILLLLELEKPLK